MQEVKTEPVELPVNDELVLKQLTVADRFAYFELYKANEDKLDSYAQDIVGKFKSADDVAVWLQNLRDLPVGVTEFGLWLGDELVGAMNLTLNSKDRAAVGYWLGKDYQGRGYATKAGEVLIDYAFAQPGIETVGALTKPDNDKSKRLMGRLGFYALGSVVNDDGQEYEAFMLKKSDRKKPKNF